MIAMPNMSKPKRCVDCVCNNDDYMCNVTHMGIDWQSQQVNEDCPLIEITVDEDTRKALKGFNKIEVDANCSAGGCVEANISGVRRSE